MKSKKSKAPARKEQQMNVAPPPQVQQQQQAPMFQQAQMSNAQQQQLYNYQQQQQQVPQVAPNSLFTNAQMQMNSNMAPQMNMQIPVQQMAPTSNVGYYGRQRTREPMDV